MAGGQRTRSRGRVKKSNSSIFLLVHQSEIKTNRALRWDVNRSHTDLCYCYWVCTSKLSSWCPDPGNKRTFSYRYSLIPSQWQEWVDSRSSFIPGDISEACPLGVFSPVLSKRRSHFPGRLSQKERKRILKGTLVQWISSTSSWQWHWDQVSRLDIGGKRGTDFMMAPLDHQSEGVKNDRATRI